MADTNNIFLAWQNRTDEGILSGGSWLAGLPLSNLQNRQVQKVTRSANVALASTQFNMDLQAARAIGVLALVVHNISVFGKVRVTASDDLNAWNNIVTASNDLSNAAWTKTAATVTVDPVLAPDGTLTADKLSESATTATHFAEQSLGTLSGTRFVEGWFYPAGRTKGRLQLVGTETASVDFDLSAGTIIAATGGATIRKYDNGWCKVTAVTTFTSATLKAQVVLLDSAGNASYAGDGTSGLYVWGIRSSTGNGLFDDSGYVDVWPSGVVPQDLLQWEDDNFWLGTLSEEQRAGYQSPYIYRLPDVITARYWRVEILDSNNAAGYIQLGRLFMARGWTPSVNYDYGAALGYDDSTVVATSLSGAEYFDMRSKARTWNLQLSYISETEAYSYVLDMQRVAGVSGEILVMPDGGANVGQKPLRSYVGRMTTLGTINEDKPTAFVTTFQIKELL